MTCVLLCGLDDRITNVACLVGCKLRVATSSCVSVRECSLSQNYDKRFMSPVILFHHTLTPKYKSNKAPTLPSNFWQHDPPISVVLCYKEKFRTATTFIFIDKYSFKDISCLRFVLPKHFIECLQKFF